LAPQNLVKHWQNAIPPAGVLYRTQASAGKARTGPVMPPLKASRGSQLFHLFPIKPELSSF
jgi:hypothetical protein